MLYTIILFVLAPVIMFAASVITTKMYMQGASRTGTHGYGRAIAVNVGTSLLATLLVNIPVVGWILAPCAWFGGVWWAYRPKLADNVGLFVVNLFVQAGVGLAIGFLYLLLSLFA